MRIGSRGLTTIELAAAALLAGVLAMAGRVAFDEAALHAQTARAHDVLEKIGAAMEAYNIDNDGYPASYSQSPLPGHGTASAVDNRLLTTPLAYLPRIQLDPFRPAPIYLYAVGPYGAHNLYPRLAYMTWSNGPDQQTQTGAYRTLTMVLANEALPVPLISVGQLAFNGMRYDPTNGVMSIGDIYIFGPRSE